MYIKILLITNDNKKLFSIIIKLNDRYLFLFYLSGVWFIYQNVLFS